MTTAAATVTAAAASQRGVSRNRYTRTRLPVGEVRASRGARGLWITRAVPRTGGPHSGISTGGTGPAARRRVGCDIRPSPSAVRREGGSIDDRPTAGSEERRVGKEGRSPWSPYH